MRRSMKRRDFNKNWTFMIDKSSMLSAGTTEQITINLPHDAMIAERRKPDSTTTSAGGYFPGGNYIYTKTFQLSEEEWNQTVLLELEGAYHKTRVYCNGAFVTSCMNGYRGFYADLTPYLVEGDNHLEIKVANSDSPNSRWYSGSGIYRPVSLLVGNDVHVKPDGLKILTPDVAEDISTVEVSLELNHCSKKAQSLVIRTVIREQSGKEVASEDTKVALFPGEIPNLRQRIYIRDANLWSVEDPYLYRCEVTIYSGDEVIDQADTEFGLRHIQVDPLHGLRMNGKEVLLRGACIHHDNGVIGAVSMLDAEIRKIKILKEAGFNAVRIAHNSASKATLTACDRVGMLVIEESFDMWNFSKTTNDYALLFASSFEEDVKAIVEKDYNHPSVIMYSIGNEIQELGTPAGAAWNRIIAELFHTLDASRFVTNAVNGLLTVMDKLPQIIQDMGVLTKGSCEEQESQGSSGDINDVMTALMGHGNELSGHELVAERLDAVFSALDISGYNYMRGRYEQDAEKYPHRITYGSETYGPDIDLNWHCVKEIPNVIGDFTWTGWDYIGESGIGMVGHDEPGGFASGYPAYLAYVGDIDITGHRRPMSYYRQIVWGLRKEPYIAVQHPQYYGMKVSCTPWVVNDSISSWTWSGQEGKSCIVEVYSDSEEVELLLNGESLGRKPVGEGNRFKAFFETSYQPGTLEAVSYEKGNITGRYLLKTADDTLKLQIVCDSDMQNNKELIYLPIQIVDGNGILHTSCDSRIALSIEGDGELLGFGSGNPKSEEDLTGDKCTTWNGKALVVIRKTGQGSIHVQASAVGIGTADITIS